MKTIIGICRLIKEILAEIRGAFTDLMGPRIERLTIEEELDDNTP